MDHQWQCITFYNEFGFNFFLVSSISSSIAIIEITLRYDTFLSTIKLSHLYPLYMIFEIQSPEWHNKIEIFMVILNFIEIDLINDDERN